MSQALYYQTHLNQVSRSFAFCIARLKSPLKEWVGLSYLLFRNLDTIEDANWQNTEEQQEAFNKFHFLLEKPQNSLHWTLALPDGLPESEVLLMKEAPKLVQDLFQLPQNVQSTIMKSLIMMSKGMQKFSNRKPLKLQNLQEVNQYCFFVAGLVGELLTELLQYVKSDSNPNSELYVSSVQFGIFLQKMNLLKDQLTDENDSKFLIPNRQELLKSLKKDADGALHYLINLPIDQKEFRLFCAWSLFLGLSSLSYMESSWFNKVFNKIPRALTEILLNRIESIIDNNHSLILYFQELTANLENNSESTQKENLNENSYQWLLDIYKGHLSQNDLVQLGLIVIKKPDQSFPLT